MNMTSTSEQRAVAYLRIASLRQDGVTAIAHQREGCQRLATRHGLTIVREYLDIGRPAVFKEQHELRRLLDDLNKQGDIAFVVVWDYARLGRSLDQLDDVCDRIRACGAQILTITGVEAGQRFVRERHAHREATND